MCGFFKRNFLGLQKFLPLTQSPLFFAARSCGPSLPGTGTLGWGAWCGVGLLAPKISISNYYPPHIGKGPSHFMSVPPPSILYECGFYNSVVVRFPFNLISDHSEWQWFYILVVILLFLFLIFLVVILMWLCEEVSLVCLCCHLDQKSVHTILKPKLSY